QSLADENPTSNAPDFLFRNPEHSVEYMVPIGFGEKNSGALLVGFSSASDCTEDECRLLDAAAQQAAFSAQISRLYLKARESAATLAQEVDRRTAEAEVQERFTEAIVD